MACMCARKDVLISLEDCPGVVVNRCVDKAACQKVISSSQNISRLETKIRSNQLLVQTLVALRGLPQVCEHFLCDVVVTTQVVVPVRSSVLLHSSTIGIGGTCTRGTCTTGWPPSEVQVDSSGFEQMIGHLVHVFYGADDLRTDGPFIVETL
jgi:hypothetical protein